MDTRKPVLASSLDQVKAWARTIQPALAVPNTEKAIEAWQPLVKATLKELITVRDETARLPQIDEFETFRRGDLTAHRLLITPPGELGWEAVILEPTGVTDKRPGWVCVHGHLKSGMSSVVGLVVDEPGGRESLDLCEGDYGLRLAERGYVTISFHCPGFGSRADDESGTPTDDMVLTHLRLGRTYLGWCVENAMSALSVLMDWPTVDPERVGAIGFSMGATVAQLHALVDDRVKAAVVSGKFGQANRRLAAGNPGGSVGLVPGVAGQVESADILLALAPRPLFVNQEVRRDPEQSRVDLAALHRTYELMRASDRLTVHYDEPDPPHHRFIGEKAYEWIKQVFPVGYEV